MSHFWRLAFLLLVVCCGSLVRAEESAYYDVRLADLTLTEGKFEIKELPSSVSTNWSVMDLLRPRVAIEGEGEAYWSTDNDSGFPWVESLAAWGTVSVRVPGAAREVVGRIDYPRRDQAGYSTVRFKISADQAKPEFRDKFLDAKLFHYQRLAKGNLPGGAWFRHQARSAELELKGKTSTTGGDARPGFDRFNPGGDFDDTFSLVTGNRAVSENLQLDRVLQLTLTDNQGTVKLSEIEGITTAEIDWKPLLAGKSPRLDALGAYIPADQHVVFFPTFDAAMRVADEADRQGSDLLRVAEPQSQDAETLAKYQRQLGLQTTALGRMLGPQVIKSLALTGGDPYFRIGTDVALLFEAVDLAALRTALVGQIVLNTGKQRNVERGSGELLGVNYESWLTADRAVSSYLASYGNVVAVTNSLAQLRRLVETLQQKTPAVASLDEYKFFRDRYPTGDAAETAFVFLSDATIRRWCSPRWRIADSRRVRDLAVLAELQAANVPKLATGKFEPGPIYTDLRLSVPGEFRLTSDGVTCDGVGSLTFLTPIGEQPLETVTKVEADAYQRWRDGYQRNFSWAFDPIGLQITVDDSRIGADLTVMPLIESSSYDEMIAVAKGKKLKPTSGDPHNAALHAVLAIDKDSAPIKQAAGAAAFFAPQLRVDVLGWIGESIAFYVDDDPIWDEFLKAIEESMKLGESESQLQQRILDKTGFELPIAVSIEVSSAFKATAFLVGVRGFIDQVGPGMVAWETKQHGDLPYVKVSPTPAAIRPGDPMEKIAIYYALTSEALTVSLNEKLIQRVLDRQAVRTKAAGDGAKAAPVEPWLGESLAFVTSQKVIQVLATVLRIGYDRELQRLSWSNLPILNEWHRLFPQEDPVALHERLWGVKLTCPAGGKYVWNAAQQTMESTALGSPDEPKTSAAILPPQLLDFTKGRYGLTFEEHGLRARGEMTRKK